jgi:hypothetical protein
MRLSGPPAAFQAGHAGSIPVTRSIDFRESPFSQGLSFVRCSTSPGGLRKQFALFANCDLGSPRLRAST